MQLGYRHVDVIELEDITDFRLVFMYFVSEGKIVWHGQIFITIYFLDIAMFALWLWWAQAIVPRLLCLPLNSCKLNYAQIYKGKEITRPLKLQNLLKPLTQLNENTSPIINNSYPVDRWLIECVIDIGLNSGVRSDITGWATMVCNLSSPF